MKNSIQYKHLLISLSLLGGGYLLFKKFLKLKANDADRYKSIEEKRNSKLVNESEFMNLLNELYEKTNEICVRFTQIKSEMIQNMVPKMAYEEQRKQIENKISNYIDDEVDMLIFKEAILLQKQHGITEEQYKNSINYYINKRNSALKSLIMKMEGEVSQLLTNQPQKMYLSSNK